jgi:5'-nucleotidase
MPDSLQNYDLVTAISSRALFDLEKRERPFEKEGLEAFNQYQIEHQNDILEPGTGFRLVKKILGLNAFFEGERKVEVIVLTKNYSEASLRITNSIEHYGLDIRRSAWTGGRPITTYLKPFTCICIFLLIRIRCRKLFVPVLRQREFIISSKKQTRMKKAIASA